MGLVCLRPRSNLYLSRGRTVLATELDGQIRPRRDVGMFIHETRLLSCYCYFVDDGSLDVSALSNVDQHTWLGYYFTRAPGSSLREPDLGSGMVPLATEETLELRVFRRVGEGLHEDLHFTNFSRHWSHFTFALSIEADFADYEESGGERRQQGHIRTEWRQETPSLTIGYEATEGRREGEPAQRFSSCLRLLVNRSPVAPVWRDGFLKFDLVLPPAGTTYICLTLAAEIEGSILPAPVSCNGEYEHDAFDEQTARFLRRATEIGQPKPPRTSEHVTAALARARSDLAELWHWTGDRELVERLLPTALGALEWLDVEGDVNADGLYEYRSRSRAGTKHQAWKDSRDAIVDEEGGEIEPPIATCEEQAFVFVAKLHMAEVCWWLDRRDLALRLWLEARDLKQRFNARFWMEPEGFFAMGLGPDGRHIRSIASNAGHCLAAGIVDDGYAKPTADRLMATDVFSGWGIRTLSAEHPAYNPYSYHRGSVWPAEQGSFALGFVRYGFHQHLERLAKAVFEASALFEHSRLPELFCGHARSADQPFPGLYPQANSPQAWSASTLFMIVQSLLGLYPYAPLRTLMLDPHLPEWLPDLTLRNLRVGEAMVDLRFTRGDEGRTEYQVLQKTGALHVIRQPSPWSLTASFGERFRDAIESLLPGH